MKHRTENPPGGTFRVATREVKIRVEISTWKLIGPTEVEEVYAVLASSSPLHPRAARRGRASGISSPASKIQ